MDIEIKQLEKNSVDTYSSIMGLLPQLYDNVFKLTYDDFGNILKSNYLKIFIAQSNNRVIAIGTLVSYIKLTGNVGIIEDFVVDEKYRGTGVGSNLLNHVVNYGFNSGISFIDVNTRREEASLFYKKNGFLEKGINRKLYSLRCKNLPI
jgi:ribosomal protein S18 acetylase RimI-like enzyme